MRGVGTGQGVKKKNTVPYLVLNRADDLLSLDPMVLKKELIPHVPYKVDSRCKDCIGDLLFSFESPISGQGSCHIHMCGANWERPPMHRRIPHFSSKWTFSEEMGIIFFCVITK